MPADYFNIVYLVSGSGPKLEPDDLGWCPFTGFEVKQVLVLLSRTHSTTTISLIHSEESGVRRQHELALCRT
jgi:hypothetical protein